MATQHQRNGATTSSRRAEEIARPVHAQCQWPWFQLNTTGNDSNSLFNDFIIVYGGQDIVTPHSKLHLDDPKVREAALNALISPTTA